MSSGEPPTGFSALRIGGFALLGVGVLAAVFGLATLLSGDSRNLAGSSDPPAAASGPRATETTSAGAPSESTGATSQAPTSSPSRSRSPAPTTPAPTSPNRSSTPGVPSEGEAGMPNGGKAGTPSGGKAGTVPERNAPQRPIGGKGAGEPIVLRVYNNSNIRGLAHRAAEDFRRAGFRVSEIDNYSGGRIPTTTVYYRPGTQEKQGARVVAERFGARLMPRFPGIEDASPGIIVILTKYYNGPAEGPVE